MYVVLQTKPDCVNVYCYKYIFILNSNFSFYFDKITYQGSIFNVLCILYWFHLDLFLFYGKYSDSSPWTSDSSRQTQSSPVHSQEPYRKYWSLYAQLIANYPIRRPRSLIRLSRLNHHPGGSGFL